MNTKQTSSLDLARTVADAVLYEGYLLYPYRSSSRKNQLRWQFGVLGPPGAAEAGVGEEPDFSVECLMRTGVDDHSGSDPQLDVHLRFLQLQVRSVERAGDDGGFTPVDELRVDAASRLSQVSFLSWDEAVPRELSLGPFRLGALRDGVCVPVHVPGRGRRRGAAGRPGPARRATGPPPGRACGPRRALGRRR